MSNRAAREKAIHLAEDFLTNLDHNGWGWSCQDAQPDTLSMNNKQRKTYIKWNVIIVWSLPSETTESRIPVDGPSVLQVDIAANEVQWL